jgi:hypothetical protein
VTSCSGSWRVDIVRGKTNQGRPTAGEGRSAVATFGWAFASEDFRRGAADDLFLIRVPHRLGSDRKLCLVRRDRLARGDRRLGHGYSLTGMHVWSNGKVTAWISIKLGGYRPSFIVSEG